MLPALMCEVRGGDAPDKPVIITLCITISLPANTEKCTLGDV